MGHLVLPKIHLERTFRAERQAVFDIIANYANFQNIIPQYYPSVRVRSVREDVAVVEEHLRLGKKELVMTTKHITKHPELHEVFVIGGDAKGSHITEKYEKVSDGTRLVVDGDIHLGWFAGLGAGKNTISEYGKIIDEFAKIIEQR